MEILVDTLKETLTVTCLVMIMMLLIEFVNVGSAGKWLEKLQHKPFLQIIVATLLGLTPGCIGGFAIVSMFTHNLLSFGALVAGMIATFGDEAFVIMAYSPRWTLILSGALFVIAIASGCVTHWIFRKKKFVLEPHGFELHKEQFEHEHGHEHSHEHLRAKLSFANLKNISFPRALLVFGLIIYIVALSSGALSHHHGGGSHEHHEHSTEVAAAVHHHDCDAATCGCEQHEHTAAGANANHHHEHGLGGWENIFFLVLACITLIVVALSSEHFLQSHLWEHVIKQHFLTVFLWTFGVLIFLKVLYLFVDVNTLIADNPWALWGLMFLAILIGIIPESGPHLVFVIMFFSGAIPFSILLVSSIVQDGHGALPLLAQSRKNFLLMKGINMVVGLIVGVIGLLLGI